MDWPYGFVEAGACNQAPVTACSAGSAMPRSPRATRMNTSASGGRSCGSRLVAAPTSCSTPGGIPPANVLTAGTSPFTCAYATASGDSPENGTRPVSISNSTTPAAYTSVRASLGAPVTCSGAM